VAFNKYNLSGKTSLITGSAGLLGFQHASALLESGSKVILTDINAKNLLETKQKLSKLYDPDLIEFYSMDVTKKESILKVFNDLIKHEIRVDILVNNAAIDPKVNSTIGIIETSRLEDFALQQWNLQIAVGLTGAFLCSQIFGAAMAKDHQGGVILNISSDLSVISPDQRLYRRSGVADQLQPVKPVTYSVIKAGLIGLTKYLATYWPEQGVRCNALSPGGVYVEQGAKFKAKVEKLIPLGRMAKVDEYKATIQYLCSDASSYMNGQNIVLDGGRSIW
jgi:NAD(P)-dependent dehydrogenase (short-subunit alcohol dehydrogenase family)